MISYELRTRRGARHMVFDTLASARERRDRMSAPEKVALAITRRKP